MKFCTLQRGEAEERTDLLSEPLDVQGLDVASVEQDRSSRGVVEPLDEAYDCRLSRSGGTDQSCRLAGGEVDSQALEDRHSRSGGVVELDVPEADGSLARLGLEAVLAEGVDGGDSVNGLVELGAGSSGVLREESKVGKYQNQSGREGAC